MAATRLTCCPSAFTGAAPFTHTSPRCTHTSPRWTYTTVRDRSTHLVSSVTLPSRVAELGRQEVMLARPGPGVRGGKDRRRVGDGHVDGVSRDAYVL